MLESDGDGPDGDISYPDDGEPCATCCGGTNCNFSDPYIVLGAEKHDAGASFPSYSGMMDELRFSKSLRYTGNFTPSSLPFETDANTVALYHFDEGSGVVLQDVSGAVGGPSNGQIKLGGNPEGPAWVMDSPFNCLAHPNNVWTPAQLLSWHDSPSNWSLNQIPTKCDQVFIGNNTAVQILSGETAICKTLEVAVGSTLEIMVGGMLDVQ